MFGYLLLYGLYTSEETKKKLVSSAFEKTDLGMNLTNSQVRSNWRNCLHQTGAPGCNRNEAALCAATPTALLETEAIWHVPLAGVKILIGSH